MSSEGWYAHLGPAGTSWINDRNGHLFGTHGFPRHAEHIASWHPAVALAVAELLSFAVETWSEDDECRSPVGPDESCGNCGNCDHRWTRKRLLGLATAYLGEQP